MTLGMIMLNENMEKKIKIMLHDSFIVYIEQKTFSQILQNMLKQNLLFEIID